MNAAVTALPLCLGTTAAAVSWLALQVLVLAVTLGAAGGSSAGAVTAVAEGYALATVAAAGTSVAVGALVCARLLVLREVPAPAARLVAHVQSLALTAPLALFGQVSAHPSLATTTLLIAGAAAGSLLGSHTGAPRRKPRRRRPA